MKKRRPLQVCHVAYSFYDSDNRVMRYAETLASRGDRVDVIALRGPGQASREDVRGVHVCRVQRRVAHERNRLQYLLKIGLFLSKCFLLLTIRGRGRSYDVVHVHNVPDFLVFAALIPKLRGTKIILDIHDVLPELYAGKFGAEQRSLLFRLALRLESWSCAFAHRVIVANHIWCDRVAGRSAAGWKCTPIINYPDLQLFRPLSSNDAGQKAAFVFLYPGSLNRHQGLDVAIAAFGEVCREMPNAEFHIYGDGPARDELERLAKKLALEGRVKFMNRVSLHDVPRLMALANVGVEPKSAQGFGNEAMSTKILEFMACGVPVVVSNTSIHAHYFPKELVSFFAADDPSDLARKMLLAYRSSGSEPAATEAARSFAVERSWQRHADEYLGLVDGLLPPATVAASP